MYRCTKLIVHAYSSHGRQARAQASLRIRAFSPEPSLSSHIQDMDVEEGVGHELGIVSHCHG